MSATRIVLLFAVGLISLALLVGCHRQEPSHAVLTPVEVSQAEPIKADDVTTQRYTGSVTPNTQVDLAFKNGGYVANILTVPDKNGQSRLVQEGDTVRAGTVLASLRQGDFTTRVAQARAQQAQAEAGVAQAAGGLAQAAAGTEQAAAGQREAEAGEQVAQAQLAEAEAGRRQAEQQIEAARIARDQAAKQTAEAQAAVEQAEASETETEAGLTKARQDFGRADALFKAESLTKSDYDAATANYAAAQAKRQQAAKQAQGARARLEEAQAQVRAAQNRIEQAQTQSAAAATRVGQARAQVGVRTAQVTQAATRVTAATGAVRSARAQVQAAQAAARGAGAQLAAAQIPQGESSLRAPINGVVLSRRVEVGSLVGQGTPAFSIADITKVKVAFGVPDLQVTALRLGQTVQLTVDAFGQRAFSGSITAISPAADPRTRVFNIEVTVPNPAQQLRIGMIVTLSLKAQGVDGGSALIPLAALVHPAGDPDRYAVVTVVKEGGKAVVHWQNVQLGTAYGNSIGGRKDSDAAGVGGGLPVYGNNIVVRGIRPGEQVVTTGAAMVHDGETVQIIGSGEEAGHGAPE